MSNPNMLLAAALAYSKRGWRVIPLHSVQGLNGARTCSCGRGRDCGSVGKHPRTIRGLRDGTCDETQIRAWWAQWPDANVGIVGGIDSGIAMLDVDLKTHGPESLKEFEDQFGKLPTTPMVETGSGGTHYFFSHPRIHKIKSFNGKLAAGLDMKADGGYVVAPPSNHESGGSYTWVVPAKTIPLAPMPQWLIDRTKEDQTQKLVDSPRPKNSADNCQHWLGKALAKCAPGNRNETGYWLACQLRDSGVDRFDAECTLRDYAVRCPRGDKAYGENEAMASLSSAYSHPARQPAHGKDYVPKAFYPGTQDFQYAPPDPIEQPKTEPAGRGSSDDLQSHLDSIMDGTIYSVPWPWPILTHYTNALTPGSITVVCGDPGVGKTYFVLQCLQYWHGKGYNPAAFFIEKNRLFHTHRLLSQLESNSSFNDFGWIKCNPQIVGNAMDKHRDYIEELGSCIHSAPLERVTLGSMLKWIEKQCKDNRRIIVVDPITAISAGKDRWTADEDFVIASQKLANDYKASLVFITHPKKGNRSGGSTGHDQAGGAAYFRFSDSDLWISRHKKGKDVNMKDSYGIIINEKLNLFIEMHKTRNGRGAGMDIGFVFENSLKFSERGCVERE